MATRPLDLSQERRKGRERKERKEGREETRWGRIGVGRRKHRSSPGNEQFRKKKKKSGNRNKNRESRSKGKRTHNERLKLNLTVQYTSLLIGRKKTPQKAIGMFLTFCLDL